MTLRLSPVQLQIIDYLKGNPANTPDMWAKATGHSVNTAYVQLGRMRAKDKEARVFRAFYNGLLGRYPWLRQYLKEQKEPTPSEQATVERALQNPKEAPTEKRGERKSIKKREGHAKARSHPFQPNKSKNRPHKKV
jgi:hypothetical protein